MVSSATPAQAVPSARTRLAFFDSLELSQTPAGHGGRTKRIRGRGGVGFDGIVPARVGLPGLDPDALVAVSCGPFGLGAECAHHGKRHVHVGARDENAVEEAHEQL